MSASATAEQGLTPEQVAERLAEGWQVIDIREPYEREAGHIPGTRHVALGQLAAEAATLDRQRPVIFYCRVGNRSGMAVEAFRGSGFDAYHLGGGIAEWVRQGQPLEPADGHVAEH